MFLPLGRSVRSLTLFVKTARPSALAAVCVKLMYQAMCRSWDMDRAVHNLMPIHIGSIQRLIPAFVRLHYSAVQTDSSEHTFATRIGQNLCVQL